MAIENTNRIKAPPLEETMQFLRDASARAEKKTDRIYRNQTSMLQWLRRKGHRVDFAPHPTNDPVSDDTLPSPQTLLDRFHGKRCPYCNNVMKRDSDRPPTRDHVKPRSAGGTLEGENRLVVCGPCNNDKADLTLDEWIEDLTKRGDIRASVVRAAVMRIKPEQELRIGNTIVVFDDGD